MTRDGNPLTNSLPAGDLREMRTRELQCLGVRGVAVEDEIDAAVGEVGRVLRQSLRPGSNGGPCSSFRSACAALRFFSGAAIT